MRSILPKLMIGTAFLMILTVAGTEDMVLEGLDGEVTTNEYKSFIDKISQLPPPPGGNIGNTLVYEAAGGGRLHGLQIFYSFTRDRRVLDAAVRWSDAFLKARNDPVNGRVIWTGRRELCWPNKAATANAEAAYSGTENGDVIEHIAATARLMLEDPSLWSQPAPADIDGFGATYLDRAKTYVRECQRSAETTVVAWYLRPTPLGYRLVHPDSPDYWKACASRGPVPWNQQQMIVGGCCAWRNATACSMTATRISFSTKKSPATRPTSSSPRRPGSASTAMFVTTGRTI